MMNFFDLLKKRLLAIIGIIGLLITFLQNLVELDKIVDQYFWTIFFISLILSISTLWTMRKNEPLKMGFTNKKKSSPGFFASYKWIFTVIILFSIIGFWRIWLIRHSVNDNHPMINPANPISKLSVISFDRFSHPQSRFKNIELIDFKLNVKKSSYKRKPEELNLSEDDSKLNFKTTLDYYYLPTKNYDALGLIAGHREYLKPQCDLCLENDRIISALKRFAISIERDDLIKYFSNTNLLRTLPERRPDITRILMPKGSEWEELKKNNAIDYGVILNWVKNCIGIPFPIFTITIQNNLEKPVIIKDIQYNFIDLNYVMAAVAGPRILSPITTIVQGIDIVRPEDCDEWVIYDADNFVVDLALKKGFIGNYSEMCDNLNEEARIYPPHVYSIPNLIYIPENQAVSFDLQFYIKSGFSWAEADILMSIEIITSAGRLRTNEFFWQTTSLN